MMTSSLLTLLTMNTGAALAAEVSAKGAIEVDARVRTSDAPAGEWYAPVGVRKGFERFEVGVGGQLEARGEAWIGLLEGQLFVEDSSRADTLTDLSQRGAVEPFRLEIDEASIELWDVGLMGLDLKLGHQVVQWGVGDQFNPTNTLNAEKMDDPLKFGEQLPNLMVRADYAASPMWTVSGVIVPIFRPSTLPKSSRIGMAFIDRMPVLEDTVRRDLQAKQAFTRDLGFPTIVDQTQLMLPEASIENMAAMARVGGAIGVTDVALSWYTGRTDMPQAVRNHTTLARSAQCHPVRTDDCIKGYMLTDADLAFPRMHVAGLNAAGEADFLGFLGAHPFGWRVEAALIFPERTVIAIENDELDLGGVVQPAGELDYGLDGERPAVVSSKPYAKWTVGLDYSIGPAVYVNAQWVHGLADEFGSGDFISPDFVTRAGDADWEIRRYRLGDYVVLGTDLTLGAATLRLFSIVDVSGYQREQGDGAAGKREVTAYGPFSKNGHSAVLYPELMVNFGEGLKVSVGTVQLFGARHTKFGDPAAGGDIVFSKVRYDF